jgi:hypothetical protein
MSGGIERRQVHGSQGNGQINHWRAAFQRLALDYGFALAVAGLAWLDNLLNRLSRQPQSMEVL